MVQTGLIDKRKKGLREYITVPSVSAVTLIGSLTAVFYMALNKIHTEGIAHPGVVMLLPIATMSWVIGILPIFMFLAYQDDFRQLNPILPSDYFVIAKRCFKAMLDNDFKVSEKNL
ncbi:hypothetical protein TSOC_011768 [Tetrabaena socialis]|uniref:Uncharacterized protein n=1 Tax=Tetrabaena socialis TaxID=47790 RepID=A0A2J7ZPT6_9CHLO|nr:hypothetical protein TSOC_011768 [Tetrabaena socialis]|eukprot:PNH02288.1 hypothetical protein TSOC_011768 [Tetrabaena socialis]